MIHNNGLQLENASTDQLNLDLRVLAMFSAYVGLLRFAIHIHVRFVAYQILAACILQPNIHPVCLL